MKKNKKKPVIKNGIVYKCEALNVRNKPSLEESFVLKVLSKGTKITVEDIENEKWFRTKVDDKEAYVMKEYIKTF